MFLGHGGDAVCSALRDVLDWGVLYGAGPDEAIQHLGLEFRVWCRCNKITFPRGTFSAGSFNLNDAAKVYPHMHSRVKAAHVRVMIPFIAEKVLELHPPTFEGKLVGTMIWALADFCQCLDRAGKWLSDDETKRALSSGTLYLTSYQALAAANLIRRRCNYKVRPKLHYFAHQILRQIETSRLNPRHLHCFGDEDFIGRIARLAKLTSGQTTSLRTLQRYLLYIALRWEHLS
jgi:hypothetical protein